MQKLDTTAIQRFLEATKRASQSRSREVRIDIADAATMATEFALLLNRLALLEHAGQAAQAQQAIAMDGGSLR